MKFRGQSTRRSHSPCPRPCRGEQAHLDVGAPQRRVDFLHIVIGMIAPPIGLNVFVVKSMTPDVTLKTIYTGVMPFVAAQVVLVGMLIGSPALATWLPHALGMK